MKMRSKLTALAAVTLLPVLAVVGGASASSEATYTVTIENTTTGQLLTPPNYAAHTKAVDVFQKGHAASLAIQQLAENGYVDGLAAVLSEAVEDYGGVSGVAGGPLFPGDSVTFDITTDADRLTIASMVVCTNDGFAGLDSANLPSADGQTRTYRVRALDAGTEINTELRADLVPPMFCGPGAGSGATNPALAENGVIRNHRTLLGVGDLDPALDWHGPVMKVTVTRAG